MLYVLAHFLRDKMPWAWNLVDQLNSVLFSLRYGHKLKKFRFMTPHKNYQIIPICNIPTDALVKFFAHQPNEAYKFFRPHGFDPKSIQRLKENKAFLAYVLIEESSGHIVGYFFNRSFFHGKGFRGRMVDINYRGRGIGTMMNCLLNEVGFSIGLRLFETVNKNNEASYKSAISASKVKVIDKMANGDLYLEILKD